MSTRLKALMNQPFTRQDCLHAARVYLFEAARRRHHPANRDFYWTLLQSAANARRRAASTAAQRQMSLFTSHMEQAQ